MTDIYQSPGDRLRFEILLKSLTEGSINLAVLSDHERVLDYYGSLFEERLRAKGENHIEWCSSTNSERLVQKFNEILSEITLDQALEKDKKHAPRRFLVFRDSILMQDFELQLLARLVNGFPAGNISVILLINSAGNYQSKLEAFGKNLLKWDVETEAGEPKQKLTDWVATTPDPEPVLKEPTFLSEPPILSEEATSVSKLLNLPTKTAWRVPGFGKKQEPQVDPTPLPTFVPPPTPVTSPPPAAPFLMPAATTPAAEAWPSVVSETSREPTLNGPAPLAAASPTATDADLFKRPARQSRAAAWVLLILLLSMATFGLMYKDLVLEEAESLKKYVLRGTPAVPAPDEAASAAAAASAQALAAAELAASMASEAALVASQAQESALAASAAVLAASEVTEKKRLADKVEAKAETKVETKAEAKAETKPEANSDEAWTNQLPANAYVVQLAAMDTQDEMRSFQRSNPAYANARIMRARHKDTGKRYFILVAGPFETKTQADAFMQSSPLLAKGWLRTSKSIKTQFTKS
jgi:cell division septation protein DedD